MFFWKYYILFSFLSLYKKDDNRTLRKKSFEVCGFGNHPFVNSSSILFIWFSPFIYYVKKSLLEYIQPTFSTRCWNFFEPNLFKFHTFPYGNFVQKILFLNFFQYIFTLFKKEVQINIFLSC